MPHHFPWLFSLASLASLALHLEFGIGAAWSSRYVLQSFNPALSNMPTYSFEYIGGRHGIVSRVTSETLRSHEVLKNAFICLQTAGTQVLENCGQVAPVACTISADPSHSGMCVDTGHTG